MSLVKNVHQKNLVYELGHDGAVAHTLSQLHKQSLILKSNQLNATLKSFQAVSMCILILRFQ